MNWLGGALEVLSLVPGLQWLAPIGAVISGGSTINSLGGFSTGGGGGINAGPWDEQISIASGKGIPQWAVWDFGSITNKDATVIFGGNLQAGWTPLSQVGRTTIKFKPAPRPAWGGCTAAPLDVMKVGDGFGPRSLRGQPNNHTGVDLAAVTGTPLYAAEGGDVTAAGMFPWGNTIAIQGPKGRFEYLHLSEMLANKGSAVSAGQLIGLTGGTRQPYYITAPHLHFQQYSSGSYVPPCGRVR